MKRKIMLRNKKERKKCYRVCKQIQRDINSRLKFDRWNSPTVSVDILSDNFKNFLK